MIATTTTNDAGNYSFPDLPAGDYQVWVTDTDNVLGELVSIGNPPTDSTVDKMGPVITVDGSADNLDQDFGFAPENHVVGNGYIGDAIFLDTGDGAGGAANNACDAGEGIEGVIVNLIDSTGAVVDTTITDEDGHYNFGNLLADESFDGTGVGEPTYQLTVATSAGIATTIGAGGDDSADSEDPSGTAVTVAQGTTDDTYDFGFVTEADYGDLPAGSPVTRAQNGPFHC